MSTNRAHRGAVPPDPTRQAAQRLLAQIADGAWLTVEEAADVRLVAEAVLEARSAENAETCASYEIGVAAMGAAEVVRLREATTTSGR